MRTARLATTSTVLLSSLFFAACAGPATSDGETTPAAAPEAAAPEVAAPEAVAPEVAAPEVAVPEAPSDVAGTAAGTWSFDPASSFQASKPSLIESMGPEFLELTAPEQDGIVAQMSQLLDGMSISIVLSPDGSVASSFEQEMFGEVMSDEAVGEWTMIDGEVHITTRPADTSGFAPGEPIPEETQVATLVGDTLTTVVDGGGMAMTMVFQRQ